MVLGSRRRALAAAASGLFALALGVTVAGRGCQADEQQIESTVRAFFAATKAGDQKAVFDLLGPQSRSKLESEAKRASELVGGAQRFEAASLVNLGKPVEERDPKIRILDRAKKEATVELVFSDSSRWNLRMVRGGGGWRVELFGK